ncbi:MAG TPA: thioredoxin [Thermoanaerobaculia bacterium]|nr:thioredoxin [Thermoanaerobaculia bacterium]
MDDVIRCPTCGQANHVPALAPGKTAVCGKCKSPLKGTVELTDTTFAETIGTAPFVVDFWAPWCGPCRMIAPILDQLAAERTDVRIGKLNVDHNPRTAAQYNARSIPLLVFFKDGVERGRVVGAVPRGRIEAAIMQFLG